KPLYAQMNGRGEFRIEGLAPGHYDLTAGTRSNGEQPARTPWLRGSLLDVDIEQVHDVTIRTQPRISGVIYGDITGINPVPKDVKIFASSSTHWSDASNDERQASYRMVD